MNKLDNLITRFDIELNNNFNKQKYQNEVSYDLQLFTNKYLNKEELLTLKCILEEDYSINIIIIDTIKLKNKYDGCKYSIFISIINSEYINDTIKYIKYYLNNQQCYIHDKDLACILNITKRQTDITKSIFIQKYECDYLKITLSNISIYSVLFRKIFNIISYKKCINVYYSFTKNGLELFPVYLNKKI
jgi:hypothetical protein